MTTVLFDTVVFVFRNLIFFSHFVLFVFFVFFALFSAALMVMLWFVYIILSALQAEGIIVI